jgi:hypothetical protein
MTDSTYPGPSGELRCRTTFVHYSYDHEPRPVQVCLIWEPSDPVAVSVEFYATKGGVVTWRFARDLLADGMLVPTGRGDVRVLPPLGGQLRIVFDSPSGHADFSVDVETVAEFLAATFTACPAGAEFAGADFEAELACWLDAA